MATPSLMNTAGMRSGPLSTRAATPVGRGSYDLNRIAEQRFRQSGNPNLLMSMDYRNLMRDRMMPPVGEMRNGEAGMPNAGPPPQAAPQGTWTPGYGGSQIYVPPLLLSPAPALLAPPDMSGNGMPRSQRAAAAPASTPPPDMMPMQPGFQFPPLPPPMRNTTAQGFTPMPWEPQQTLDITQPLPPSTLGGGVGLPPPPQFSMQSLGGFDILTQNTPEGAKYMNSRQTPAPDGPPPLSAAELGRITAAGFEPFQIDGRSFDAQGVPYLRKIPAPMETVTVDPVTGERRTFKRPMGEAPAQPAAPAPVAPGGAVGGKAGGYEYKLKSSDTMQSGQVPTGNYAAPLTPEQSLRAAHDEYARSGYTDGSAFDRHFAQFPSDATRALQKEQAVWKVIGDNIDSTPGAPVGNLNTLYAQANRANAQYQAAYQGLPPVADWGDDPGRVAPRVQPLPVPPERPYLETAYLGAQNFIKDSAAAGRDFVNYARRNPLVTFRQ